jgi:hypothetical protein
MKFIGSKYWISLPLILEIVLSEDANVRFGGELHEAPQCQVGPMLPVETITIIISKPDWMGLTLPEK